MDRSTIAAISTPMGQGGIGVIRISGESAFDISKTIFRPLTVSSIDEMDGYTAAYGNIYEKEKLIDNGIITVFKAPKSYTGENVVEISCHGGMFITSHILHLILENGACLAEPGEFSKRAFLNGKMSLTQAESVIDIIEANNKNAVQMAVVANEGNLFKEISSVSKNLVELSAYFSAWFDYPEDDIEEMSIENIKSTINNAIIKVGSLIDGYGQGKIIREGIPTVIVGKPNVGKSTLMNILSGAQTSIVTDVPGTTRDIIEQTIRIGDLVLNISDTAGIRSTDDVVEQVGVELAQKRVSISHLILAVFDSSNEISKEDKQVIELTNRENTIAIINKSDLEQNVDMDYINSKFDYVVMISAKNSDGISNLKNCISNILKLNQFDPSAPILANERQLEAARQAYTHLLDSMSTLDMGDTLDMVSVSLESAIDSLLQLTGERANDKIIETVFARFCLGK